MENGIISKTQKERIVTEQKDSINPICDGCNGEILGYIVTRGSHHLHPQTACFKKAFDKGLISSERF